MDRRELQRPSVMEPMGWLREGEVQDSSELIALGELVLLPDTGESERTPVL